MKFLSVILIVSFALVINSACTPKPLTPEEEFNKMAASEHLQTAKSKLEVNNFEGAKKHIDAITKDKAEFNDAQTLAIDISKAERAHQQKYANRDSDMPIWLASVSAYDRARNDAKRQGLSPEKEEYLQDKYKAQIAKKYKITLKQLEAILAQGNRERWPLPEEARSTKVLKSDAVHEKENAEFGKNLYKAADKVGNQ